MTGLADKIYRRSPILAQHALVSAYGLYWKRLRFGGAFRTASAGFLAREWYTREQWHAYTEQKLREVLLLAFDRVPFYQRHWKGIVNREQLSLFTTADMPSLPPVEKAHSRDFPLDLLIDGRPQRAHKVFHTSGSSGTPVATYWLPDELRASLAIRETRSCRFAGVSFSQPRATFSGRIVEPDPLSSGPYYRFNWFEKQVYFSAFHLRPENIEQYLQALRRHNIVWMTGYSNSIYQFAQMAYDQGLNAPALKAVITTSEKITPEMRSIVEMVFQTRVYEEYDTVEEQFHVCENEFGQKLVNPDVGLLEITDDWGRPVPTGEPGQVLATGFIRTTQPLIRYRIGDTAILSDEAPRCGRQMPVLKEVIGRIEDTIYGIDGRRMVRFHGIFINQPNIQEGQIIQEKLDLIRVRIVPKANYSESDEEGIVARIQQRLTTHMNVIVEAVDSIERTKAGKFRAVISNLSAEERERISK